jgi:hypothetical protein
MVVSLQGGETTMSDIPEGYFLNGVELLNFRREPIVYYPNSYGQLIPKKKKKNKSLGPNKRVTLLARDGNSCHYCDEVMGLPKDNGKHYPQEITIDHIVPRSIGGSNMLSNLVLACYRCNHSYGSLFMKCDCEFCQEARRRFRGHSL